MATKTIQSTQFGWTKHLPVESVFQKLSKESRTKYHILKTTTDKKFSIKKPTEWAKILNEKMLKKNSNIIFINYKRIITILLS